MPLPALLPDSARLALQQVSIDGGAITLTVQALATTSQCPGCGHPLTRIHSRYTRTLADRSWQSKAVRIKVQVRRFFCLLTACPRKTFTERLPELAAVSAHDRSPPERPSPHRTSSGW